MYLCFLAVQMMAQAHLASLDMSSVDKEDPSSGDEEEEDEKTPTDSGTEVPSCVNTDIPVP